MKKIYNVIVFTIMALAALAQPANDECINAQLVALNEYQSIVGTTVGANPDVLPVGTSTNGGVWFKFVATHSNIRMSISTTDPNGIGALTVNIFKGSCGSLTPIMTLNTSPYVFSSLTNYTIGETYYVHISANNVEFRAGFYTFVNNDFCNDAEELAIGNEITGSTIFALEGGAECGSQEPDVWYSFIATSTKHTITVTATVSHHIKATVLSGDCGDQICIAEKDNPNNNEPININLLNLNIGDTYYIRVSEQGIQFKIKVTIPIALCDNVTEILCSVEKSVNLVGDGELATIVCLDGTNTSSGLGKEVIYKFTPSKSGTNEIQLTSPNGQLISYYIKPVSQGCDNLNWQCLGALGSQQGAKLPLNNLTACTEYYLLLDAASNLQTLQTFKIIPLPIGSGCSQLEGANLITPQLGATNVPINTSIAWTSISGAAGYKIKISTLNSVLVNTTDVGLTTSFQPPTSLPANTTIYVKITPYTCKGEESNYADMGFTTTAITAPTNDLCTNATQLAPQPFGTSNCSGGAINQTTVGATANAISAFSFCLANEDDVFYKFTTTIAGTYTVRFCNINLANGQSNGTIGMAVMDNCTTPHGLASCAQGTITNGMATQSMSNLLANTTYYLIVWCPGADNAYNFDISVITPDVIPRPSNDACSGAIAFPTFISNNRSTITGNTTGATASGLAACNNADDDVWYKFTVPQDISILKYELNSGSYSSEFKIYSGTCGTLTEIGTCYDAAAGTITGLVGGNTYYLRAYTKAANVAGEFGISLSVPIAGDYCENAIQVPNLLNIDKFCYDIETFGSLPSSVPLCNNTDQIDNDIYLSFTVPPGFHSIEMLSERLAGSTNVMIQLLSGTCGSLTPIRCFELGLGSNILDGLTSGETYYLRIYNQILFTSALYRICLNKPAFHFSEGSWTDASKWTPYYPGITIPTNAVAILDGNCTVPQGVEITNNGKLSALAKLTFNSKFTNNRFFNETIHSSDALKAPLIENYGDFQIYYYNSGIACSSVPLNFEGQIVNKSSGHFLNFNALNFISGGKLTNEGSFENNSRLSGMVINQGTFQNSSGRNSDLSPKLKKRVKGV